MFLSVFLLIGSVSCCSMGSAFIIGDGRSFIDRRSRRRITPFFIRKHDASTTRSTAKTKIMAKNDKNNYVEIDFSARDVIWTDTVPNYQASVPEVVIVNQMPEFLQPSTLHNKYYLLRHGQSTANVAEVISSDRKQLAYSTKHGLTELGYQQGIQSGKQLLDILQQTSKPNDIVLFISSPFARARQTALACMDGLLNDKINQDRITNMGLSINYKSINIHNNLVERYFGRLDNEAIYTYAYVWPLDLFNVTHTAFDVESVAAVCTRIRSLIIELETIYNNNNKLPKDDETNNNSSSSSSNSNSINHIVLVSHADVLQIAQLFGAHATNVGAFSSYRFKNGEVREMKIGDTTHLPDPDPLEKPFRGTKQFVQNS